MTSKLKPKRSYTANAVPVAGTDLDLNEIAINYADKILYVNQGGSIVSVPLGGGGGGSGLSWVSAPASATASGTAGQIAYDGDYIYIATGSGTWKRAAIATWSPTDQFFSSVSLLLHMNGSGSSFVDSSASPVTITAYGNATQTSTQSKWGGSSAYFDGSGDYLSIPTGNHLNFGTDDFAIELWVRMSTIESGALYCPFGMQDNTAGSSPILRFTIYNGVWGFAVRGGAMTTSAGIDGPSALLNTWQHVAVSRSSGSIRFYIDGVQAGSTLTPASNPTLNITLPMLVGAVNLATSGTSPDWFMHGYVDDIRITKGSARGYTGSTITVPTAEFPNA